MTLQRTLSILSLFAVTLYCAGPADFIPDGRISGSALTGWHTVGATKWKVANGEVTASPSGDGGWLVLDKSYQDVQFFEGFKCAGACKTGVLLRAAKTPEGGLKGIYVSLTEGDLATYNLTLDAQGKEVQKVKVQAPPAPAGRGGRGPARGPELHKGDWNEVLIAAYGFALRPTLNGLVVPNGAIEESSTYGAVALYAGGAGDIQFRDVAWKDINTMTEPREVTSTHFSTQRISDFYYGWGATVADINKDGVQDVISGPYYYMGPSFTERRIYREGRQYNPATEYAPDMVNYAYDFNGDGWTDILSTEMRAMALYVNPAGESRRWQRHMVLPEITTEIVLLRDLDGDGKPEIVYGGANGYAWARPDPKDPTAKWPIHRISGPGTSNIHGLGAGDINGDGKLDVVAPSGWYEQPAAGPLQENWIFHQFDFSITAPPGVLPGGGMSGVYDVNGDGKNDVVMSLASHDWGLAWFEQKKATDGSITFVKHLIAHDFSTKNAGGVVFSEPHACAYGDIDGDGIPDFITGKSLWHHLENYNGPDPYGPAVVYVYRTVRNPKAEGGAEFVPELVHNRSGVGSSIGVADVNKDGTMDIVTASGKGTFVFFNKPGRWKR